MPPTITSLGRVVLNGNTFTCDPDVYEPFNWQKRVSVHPVLGGKTVVQDFGLYAVDNTIKLSSGQKFPLDTFILDALRLLYAAGGTYTLTDWMFNTFTVYIRSFRWWPNLVGPLYFYDMDLQVRVITQINSAAYSGS